MQRYNVVVNERAYWEDNVKTFYKVKALTILMSLAFLIATVVIYQNEVDDYFYCDIYSDAGTHFHRGMMMLIIFHSIDLLYQFYDMATVKSHGFFMHMIRGCMRCNQLYGLFVYIYIQVQYWRNSGHWCRHSVFDPAGMKTGNWFLAEIIFFYVGFLSVCCLSLCLGFKIGHTGVVK